MDRRRLYITLEDLKFPSKRDLQGIHVSIITESGSGDLHVGSSFSIKSSPDSIASIYLYSGSSQLGSGSFPLGKLLGEVFIETGEGRVSLSFTSKRSDDSTYGDSYLSGLQKSQEMHLGMQSTIEHLSRELGAMYNRILNDSVRLRNSQKIKPKKHSPYYKPAPLVQVPNVKVRSNCTDLLDEISSHDFPTLVLSIIGITGKREINAIKNAQSEALQFLNDISDHSLDHQQKQFESVQTKGTSHLRHIRRYLSNVQDSANMDKKENITLGNSVKAQIGVKDGLDSLLQNLYGKTGVQVESVHGLEELEANYEQINRERKSISSEFLREVSGFSKSLRSTYEIIKNTAEETKKLQSLVEIETEKTENLQKEIDLLDIDVLSSSGKAVLEQSKTDQIKCLQEEAQEHRKKQNILSSSMNQLSTSKHKTEVQSFSFTNEIIDKNDSLDAQGNQLENALKSQNYTFSSIEKQLKEVENTSEQLSNMIKESQKRERILKKSTENFEEKDKTFKSSMRELEYLSDFTLKWTNSALNEKRVHKQVTELKKERENELQVMTRALKEVKEKYPIYTADKNDHIDVALAHYLNQSDRIFVVAFIRLEHSVYLYGTRKTILTIERQKLRAKVGGGFLTIDQFIDAYETIEKERSEAKAQEYSPTARKFMGKWAEGIINERETSPVRMRESLVEAVGARSRTTILGVRERSPNRTLKV